MDICNLKTKPEVDVQRSESILDIFHIAFLIRSFLICDPSPHLVGWWSSMSSFLMFVTYKRYFFFLGSMFYAYVFNILLLSDVLLKTVKTYQPLNLWCILLEEVPHGFTLECNQRQGINHSSSLLIRVQHFPPWVKVKFLCPYFVWLVNI